MIEEIITRYNATVQEIDWLKNHLNFIYRTMLFWNEDKDFQEVLEIHAKIVRLELIAERLSSQF